jgi:hemolysin III
MINEESRKELANALTHFAGFLIFLSLTPFLLIRGWQPDNRPLFWTLLAFVFGLMMVYSSSTLYHFAKKPALKFKFRIWDHISIYFLIGGSYTPLVVKYVSSEYSGLFLLAMWSLITVGVLFKLFFTGKYDMISTLSYLGLGWMALFIIKPLIANAPTDILLLIIAGGLSYSAGVIFYKWKGLFYHHAIWHVFVLGGSLNHFLAVRFALE